MIPFLQNFRKYKLIYGRRLPSGCPALGGVSMFTILIMLMVSCCILMPKSITFGLFKYRYFIACQWHLNKVILKKLAHHLKKGKKLKREARQSCFVEAETGYLECGEVEGKEASSFRDIMVVSWSEGCLHRHFTFGNSSSWARIICTHFCICAMLWFKILFIIKNNPVYICHRGAEFCNMLLALLQVEVSATPILGDEFFRCAFLGGRKISSEVSQKAVYYFYKWGMCLF